MRWPVTLLKHKDFSSLGTPDMGKATPSIARCRRKKGKLYLMKHKIDRLSKLPDSVIEHILSFITLKKILQLSILSKRWQSIWTLFPMPKINQNLVWPNLYKIPDNRKVREQEYQRKRDEFNYFVEKTLLHRYRQKKSIKKIELSALTIDDESCCAFLNRWIGYAIESNVEVLYLWVWPNKYYYVPQSVVAAKSMTELSLVGCNLEPFYSDINLSSLKKLVLDEVYVEDQLVQALIASCHVVEEITFARCDGLKNIHVLGLPKLMAIKLLYIPKLDSFEVEAPNLKSLLIKLWKPCEINLFPCGSLKKLELYSATVTDNWLHDVLSKHPLIKSLKLNHCDMLKRIKISSDRMKNLAFIRCNELIELDIVTPNLHRFNYHGNVISFSSIASTLSEFCFAFPNGTSLDIEEIEFLSKLSHSKLMTWKACYAESVITPYALREIQSSPLYNVKQLELQATFMPMRSEIKELKDAIWLNLPQQACGCIVLNFSSSRDSLYRMRV